jgi:glutathione S-transferase
MVLNYKGLPFRSIDALALDQLAGLASRNSRVEVPVIVDGDLTIVDSADIVAYVEDRYPEPPILPRSPELRARARHWQRVADRVLDAVIHDISLWSWPTHHRQDEPPRGLLEAGRRDIEAILRQLDDELDENDHICGELSIADIAVFVHVSSLKPLGIQLDDRSFPRVRAWFRRMRTQPVIQSDLEYVKAAGVEKFVDHQSPYEGEKVVWRGDRIEWLLCNGFDEWWSEERATGRAVIPSNVTERT